MLSRLQCLRRVQRLVRELNVATGVCGYSKDKYKKIGYLMLRPDETDQKYGVLGEDAFYINKTKDSIDTYGLADGVGGWRNQGVDPSIFSSTLMMKCMEESQTETNPKSALGAALEKMKVIHNAENYRLLGSSTAVCLTLDKENERLTVANLGDSAILVIRDGSVLLRSKEQTHRFNCPYQLSLPTPGYGSITDSPTLADEYEISVKPGDIIVTGSDGLFDNLSDSVIIDVLSGLTVENFEEKLEEICQVCLAVAVDENYLRVVYKDGVGRISRWDRLSRTSSYKF